MAQQKFALAEEPILVEEAVYEWKSLEARHAYLLKIYQSGEWE